MRKRSLGQSVEDDIEEGSNLVNKKKGDEEYGLESSSTGGGHSSKRKRTLSHRQEDVGVGVGVGDEKNNNHNLFGGDKTKHDTVGIVSHSDHHTNKRATPEKEKSSLTSSTAATSSSSSSSSSSSTTTTNQSIGSNNNTDTTASNAHSGGFEAYGGLGFSAHANSPEFSAVKNPLSSTTSSNKKNNKTQQNKSDTNKKTEEEEEQREGEGKEEKSSWLSENNKENDGFGNFSSEVNWSFDDKDNNSNTDPNLANSNLWGTNNTSFDWSFDWQDSQSNKGNFNNTFAFQAGDWGTNNESNEINEEPTVDLPGEAAPSGEETDLTHFHCAVKIYRFDLDSSGKKKVWKQQGEGELYINSIKGAHMGRLLCRQNETGLVRLNCLITSKFSYKVIHQDRVQFAVPLQNETKKTTEKETDSDQKTNDTDKQKETAQQDDKTDEENEDSSAQLVTYCIKPNDPADLAKITTFITTIQNECQAENSSPNKNQTKTVTPAK